MALTLRSCMVSVSSALLAMSVHEAPAQQVGPPIHAVGDSWSYTTQDNGDAKKNFTRTVVAVKDNGDAITTTQGKALAVYTAGSPLDGTYYRFDADAPDHLGAIISSNVRSPPFFEFPLYVGKKWPFHPAPYKSAAGDLIEDEFDAEVTSFENVTTPAGVFAVFKIKMNGWWNNRSKGVASVKGRKTREFWYAPSAKRVIFAEVKAYDWHSGPLLSSWTLETTNVSVKD